jgi:hypothetical protein
MSNFRLLVLASDLWVWLSDIEQHTLNKYQSATIKLDNFTELAAHSVEFWKSKGSRRCQLGYHVAPSTGQILPTICVFYVTQKHDSARFLIYPDQGSQNSEPSQNTESGDDMSQAPKISSAQLFMDRSWVYLDGQLDPAHEAAPILLYCGYSIFNFVMDAYRSDQREENRRRLKVFENAFQFLSNRWKLVSTSSRIRDCLWLTIFPPAVYMTLLNANQKL